MTRHPIAAHLFPEQPLTDEFLQDVAERGVIYPITVYEGMVLDGWKRYAAALRTGTHFKTQVYTGTDPAGCCASHNGHRRGDPALLAERVHALNGHPLESLRRRYGA